MKIKIITYITSLFACLGAIAQAATTYSNLGPSESFSSTNGWSVGYPFSESEVGQSVAFSFTATTSGVLDSANLALSRLGGSNQSILAIYSDSSSSPGSLLDSTSAVVPDSPSLVTFSFTSGVFITSGVTYWLGLHPASATGTDLAWWWNYLESGLTSDAWQSNSPDKVLPDQGWERVISGLNSPAFSVSVVPEPSSLILCLKLKKSDDGMASWQPVPITGAMITADGKLQLEEQNSSSVFYRLDIEVPPSSMVLVSGGTLPASSEMGAVAVDTFYIGKYEVTWGEWQTVRTWAAANGYDIGSRGAGCADAQPVHTVAWYDVIKWCNAKSQKEGVTPVYTYNGSTYKSGEPDHTLIAQNLSANGYRLPQEVEWEFAARGGNQTNGYTYSGSNVLDDVGWYADNSSGAACDLYSGLATWPVGQKVPNELGLYDMSGNVWEWCWDLDGTARRIRGGSWYDNALYCTVSIRNSVLINPVYRYPDYGFRTARSSGN